MTCGDFRHGPICSQCEPGYRALDRGSACVKCPSRGTSVGLSILFAGLAFIALCVAFWVVVKTRTVYTPGEPSFEELIVRATQKNRSFRSSRLGYGNSSLTESQVRMFGFTASPQRSSRLGSGSMSAGTAGGGLGGGGGGGSGSMNASGGSMDDLGGGGGGGMGRGSSFLGSRSFSEDQSHRTAEENLAALDEETTWEENGQLLLGGGGVGPTEDAEETLELDSGVVLGPDARASITFTYSLKIFVSFLQIITNVTLNTEIPWPSAYTRLMNHLEWINLEFIPWQSVSCAAALDFFEWLFLYTLTPVGVLTLVFCLFYIPIRLRERFDVADDDAARERRRQQKQYFTKIILFTLFLMYPGVSRKVLETFVCRDIDGTQYLVADFDIQCYTGDWLRFLPYEIFVTLVYPLGIPAAMFYLIRRKRQEDRLRDPATLLSYGFLYEAYQPSLWWFEVADMGNKLFLVSLVTFFPVTWQMPIALAWVGCFLVVILVYSPYIRPVDDRTALGCMSLLFCIFISGYVAQENNGLSESMDKLLSTIFIALLVCVTLLFLLTIYFWATNSYAQLQRRRSKRRLEKLESLRQDGKILRDSLELATLDGGGDSVENLSQWVGQQEQGAADDVWGDETDPYMAVDEDFGDDIPDLDAGEGMVGEGEEEGELPGPPHHGASIELAEFHSGSGQRGREGHDHSHHHQQQQPQQQQPGVEDGGEDDWIDGDDFHQVTQEEAVGITGYDSGDELQAADGSDAEETSRRSRRQQKRKKKKKKQQKAEAGEEEDWEDLFEEK